MTPQEIFTKVAVNLRKQVGPSIDDRNRCRYNGPAGSHCAIGWLLPEGVGDKWEGLAMSDVFEDDLPEIEPWMRKNAELLQDLQGVHDSAAHDWNSSEYGFEARIAQFATRHNLKMPEVQA